ncbi:MAG: hypothetical protein WCT05_14345 [Lentisphaeria bacterium]
MPWKSLVLLLVLFSGVRLHAQLLVEEKEVERDGKKVLQVKREYLFKQSSLIYRYHLDPDEKTLLKGKWGDYFFGLKHGTVNNGSWCTWDFLQVNQLQKGRRANLLNQAPVTKTGMSRFAGGQLAEFVWQGGISFRLIQYEAMPEWLFGRVQLPEQTADLEVVLGAWPGGTHWESPGRERHLVLQENDLLLTNALQNIPFAEGQGNALALYNRNYSERNGNFLVFDGSQVASLTANAGGNNKVQMIFKPADGKREFTFAMSYFLDVDPGETVARFLGEQAPNIIEILQKVDWNPAFDSSGFQRDWQRCRELLAILQKSNIVQLQELSGHAGRQLDELRQRFADGEAANDSGQCSTAWQELEVLRLQLGKAWLETLK